MPSSYDDVRGKGYLEVVVFNVIIFLDKYTSIDTGRFADVA